MVSEVYLTRLLTTKVRQLAHFLPHVAKYCLHPDVSSAISAYRIEPVAEFLNSTISIFIFAATKRSLSRVSSVVSAVFVLNISNTFCTGSSVSLMSV